jgi:hypothetical protein
MLSDFKYWPVERFDDVEDCDGYGGFNFYYNDNGDCALYDITTFEELSQWYQDVNLFLDDVLIMLEDENVSRSTGLLIGQPYYTTMEEF